MEKTERNIAKLLMALLMLVLSATATHAQGTSQRQRMTREQLAEAQAKYIARELALSDAATNKFVNTYQDFQKELWALGPRLRQNGKAGRTDAEAQQSISERFERSQKILTLREKFYKKYSTFLTQKQIQQVYELERQMMRRLSQRSRPAKPRR